MDLNTVTEVGRATLEAYESIDWREGDAWLAGGTWLFSVPQPHLHRLVDLTRLGWEPLTVTDAGVSIAATCTIRDLYAFRPARSDWTAGPLFIQCCEAFLSSFKVWNSATVGGNICMSLPAGPMTSLAVALEATYMIWTRDGKVRQVDAADFVTGDNANILEPGDVLRSLDIPVAALKKRTAFRRFSLVKLGRSSALVIGTVAPATSEFQLSVTAATTKPVRISFASIPDSQSLQDRLSSAIPDEVYFGDPNGNPAHRKHLTRHFAQQIRTELAASSTS